MAATPVVVQAVGDIVAGHSPGVWCSFSEGFARIADLVWTLARGWLIVLALTITIIGLPWAINRSVRWMFGSQAAVLGGIRGTTALDDSAAAVRGRWWQAAATGAVLGFIGAAPGVLVALLLLIVVRFPVDAANSVASLVYALAQPFAIVGLTLLYLRWHGQPVVPVARQGRSDAMDVIRCRPKKARRADRSSTHVVLTIPGDVLSAIPPPSRAGNAPRGTCSH